jgi:hypothetical protein
MSDNSFKNWDNKILKSNFAQWVRGLETGDKVRMKRARKRGIATSERIRKGKLAEKACKGSLKVN